MSTISSEQNNYFGYVKVGGEHSSTKLYSVSPMEVRFRSIVENFVNKRSTQLTKNEILRTLQIKNAANELNKLNEAKKGIFNNLERAFNDFEKLKSDEEMSKVIENSKVMQLDILDHENKSLENIINEALNDTLDKEILNMQNSTAKIEGLNQRLMFYSELSNNTDLIVEKKYQLNYITIMKLDLGDEFISNIFEYHKLLDTFNLVNDFEKIINDSIHEWGNIQENIKILNSDLFGELAAFSNLKFSEIEPKRGELMHDINNPNFNDEKLAKTLMEKIIKNIKEKILSNVEWVTIYEKTILLPENSVEGGIDDEDNKYYVIRKELNHKNYYGKYVRSETRKNAYFTTENEDKGVEIFEVKLLNKINNLNKI